MFDKLYVYACKENHRVYRKSEGNPAPCSRCRRPFHLLTVVDRIPGEADRHFEYRALSMRERKVS